MKNSIAYLRHKNAKNTFSRLENENFFSKQNDSSLEWKSIFLLFFHYKFPNEQNVIFPTNIRYTPNRQNKQTTQKAYKHLYICIIVKASVNFASAKSLSGTQTCAENS